MAANDFEPDGAGPYLDVEAGYRWTRAWSASAFGSYTRFSGEVPASGVTGFLTVHDTLYDAGLRVARHHFRWWFGGGLGYEHDTNVAYQGMTTTHELGFVEETIGYRLASARFVDCELMVLADEAFGDGREVVSIRAGIGLRL